VRREGVTEAAGKLQKAGVIIYRRGHIKVLDRAKLEAMSCECYEVVRAQTDRLLPLVAPTRRRDCSVCVRSRACSPCGVEEEPDEGHDRRDGHSYVRKPVSVANPASWPWGQLKKRRTSQMGS
jgi:hypothetical protein